MGSQVNFEDKPSCNHIKFNSLTIIIVCALDNITVSTIFEKSSKWQVNIPNVSAI